MGSWPAWGTFAALGAGFAIALAAASVGAQTLSTPVAGTDATKAKLIAVLEFRTKLGAAEQTEADPGYFSDVVRAQALDELPRARLMTHENMLVLLAAQGKDLSQCEGECEVDTGRKLGADFVISGELLKVGTNFKLDLKLHATASGELLAGAQASGKSVDDLDAAVPACVKKLTAPLTGTLGGGEMVDTSTKPVAQQDAAAQPPVTPPPVEAPKPASIGGAAAANIGAPAQASVGTATPPATGAAGNPQITNVEQAKSTRSGPTAWYATQKPAAVMRAEGQQPAQEPRYQTIRVYPDHIEHKQHYFDVNKVTLRPQSGPMIREIAAALRAQPGRDAAAVCRADLRLPISLRHAKQRAFAIRHALIEEHVAARRIQALAIGKSEALPGHSLALGCTIILK